MRVELTGVHKRFGKTEVLRGIDLVLPEGRRVAFVGPNGAGKSTLIRALLGLVACDGEVKLDGRSPFDDRVEVARRLAYVPQVAPQLAAPVEDLVQLVCTTRGLTRDRVQSIARRLALDLDAIANRPFRNLSGGMKQKLLLALAFASDATLLVLDEPTASLDAEARDRFFSLVSEAPPTTTLILCSHRLEEVRHLATHVVELAEGRVVRDGPVDEVLATPRHASVESYAPEETPARWLQGRGLVPVIPDGSADA